MLLRFNIIGFIIILVTMTGCDRISSQKELELFVIQTKSMAKKKAEVLPEDLATLDYKYLGKGQRSPFVTPKEYILSQVSDAKGSNRPDVARTKEVLEQYDLQDLKMVGTLKKSDGTSWGLIKDSENIVYKIKIGNFIGKNFGKVVRVTDKQIEINESISNSYGGWITNSVIIKMED